MVSKLSRTRLRELFRLACVAGVDTFGKLPAGGITLLAGEFQTHVGVHPKRKPLFLSANTVFPAPPLPASGVYLQI